MFANTHATAPIWTVSSLANQIRKHLETGLAPGWLAGEISNLTYAASGHVYFTLKDAGAQLKCTFWRSKAQALGWQLQNGQQIEAWVMPTVYEARGDLQLNVETVRHAGIGSLYEQFLQLKQRLETEGLFTSALKRPLPTLPRTIGVITSPQGAAWQDIQTTLARRAPHVQLILAPTPVQGPAAVPGILAAFDQLAKMDCVLILLCRGGGSLEDLWAFNNESVARAIRACPVPVITGIGHETDFTIADFAADLRAPTPTAAAEQASPDRADCLRQLAALQATLNRAIQRNLQSRAYVLDQYQTRLIHPGKRLRQLAETLRNYQHRLELAGKHSVEARARLLAHLHGNLQHLNPTAILARGYSLVRNAEGHLVTDNQSLQTGEVLRLQFARGEAKAAVLPTA